MVIDPQWRRIIVVEDLETINAFEVVLSQAMLNPMNEKPWSVDAGVTSVCCARRENEASVMFAYS